MTPLAPADLDLLTRLRQADIRLSVDGESLRVSAPAGAVTPELRAELAQHKAELLAFLRSTGGEGTNQGGRAPIVEIQHGAGKAPFFFLHGDFTGGGYYAHRLARGLGPDRPYYALQPHGLDSEDLPRTMEAMAASFVKPLLGVRREGPLLLGGYCAGAWVALELARLLTARGENVELVVVLDPPIQPPLRIRLVRRLVAGIGAVLRISPERQLNVYLALWRRYGRGPAAARGHAEHPEGRAPWHRALDLVLARLCDAPGNSQGRATLAGKAALDNTDMGAKYVWVRARYRPRVYDGRVTLLQFSDRPVRYLERQERWWRSLARHLEIRTVPGDHDTSITQHNAVLAEQLRLCLEERSQPPAGEHTHRGG